MMQLIKGRRPVGGPNEPESFNIELIASWMLLAAFCLCSSMDSTRGFKNS